MCAMLAIHAGGLQSLPRGFVQVHAPQCAGEREEQQRRRGGYAEVQVQGAERFQPSMRGRHAAALERMHDYLTNATHSQ